MSNKPSHFPLRNLIGPSSIPPKPLQLRSPDNSQNNSRRPSQILNSPQYEQDNALNFYLNLPQKPSTHGKPTRNPKAYENINFENENFVTEPAQYSQENSPSPNKGNKSANRSPAKGSIVSFKLQSTKNKEQKIRSRGIDSLNPQVNKDSAYSTIVLGSPKVSAYNSVNAAQTHLLIKSPNVNRKLENQINQSGGLFLANEESDNNVYWETLEKKFSSPVQPGSVVVDSQYQSNENFTWGEDEMKPTQFTFKGNNGLFSSPRTVSNHDTISSYRNYESARRASKPEFPISSYREKEEEVKGQQVSSVRNNHERNRSDMNYVSEVSRGNQQVKSPGQVRKANQQIHQRVNSGSWKDVRGDSLEDLGISRRSNYSDKEKVRLMDELMSLRKMLEERDAEAQELYEEERRQEMENQRMMDEIKEVEKARKENEEMIRKLKERTVGQEREIGGLKRCKEELEKSLKEFGGKAKEFKECSNRVKKCRAEVDRTNQQILELNERLGRIKGDEERMMEEEKRRNEEEIRRLKEEVDNREEDIRELEKELKGVNEKKEEYRMIAEKIKELEELQGELMEENDNLRERLEGFFKEQKQSYKQGQNSELGLKDLQEKEQRDMEEVSGNLVKVKKRLEEIENYSLKIMKIIEYSKQGKELPIELILPHNRSVRADKKGRIEEDGMMRKKMDSVEVGKATIHNIKLAEEIRNRLEQSVVSVLEEYNRKNKGESYY